MDALCNLCIPGSDAMTEDVLERHTTVAAIARVPPIHLVIEQLHRPETRIEIEPIRGDLISPIA